MTPCPVCGQPMNPRRHPGRLKLTCSRTCGHILRVATRLAQESDTDPAAIWRLTAGAPPEHTTRAERIQATRILTRRGMSEHQIADLLKVTPRSIARYRHELTQRKATTT